MGSGSTLTITGIYSCSTRSSPSPRKFLFLFSPVLKVVTSLGIQIAVVRVWGMGLCSGCLTVVSVPTVASEFFAEEVLCQSPQLSLGKLFWGQHYASSGV